MELRDDRHEDPRGTGTLRKSGRESLQPVTQAKTVSQAVYESLRELILDGTLEPGAKLSQDDIASQLGVSRMPVREALGRLEADGMVVFETYRGAFVSPLALEEAEQIYLMRLALEPLLARLGTERLDEARIAELERAQAGMRQALGEGDTTTFFEHVRSFHAALYAAADMPLVLGQVQGLRDLAQRYILRYLALPGRLPHVVHNHDQILAAARAGNAGEVERLIREELGTTRDALVTLLRAENAPPP